MQPKPMRQDMIDIATATKAELEGEIVGEASLYAMFDESRLLNDGYSVEEMREICHAWVLEGSEV